VDLTAKTTGTAGNFTLSSSNSTDITTSGGNNGADGSNTGTNFAIVGGNTTTNANNLASAINRSGNGSSVGVIACTQSVSATGCTAPAPRAR